MTIEKQLIWAKQQLCSFCNPDLEAEVLLSALIQKERAWVKSHKELSLTVFEYLKYKRWIAQRKKNIPVAYILGYKDFSGITLKVNRSTLIPRDETEVLCDHVVRFERNYRPQSLLDIGTGSGAISIVLGKAFGQASQDLSIIALDISKKALQVAKFNAKNQKLDIDFLYSNMLDQVEQGSSFDIVVANLPYVPEGMELEKDLEAEPSTALYSGQDGLDHIRQLAKELRENKIVFKELWLEFLPEQARSIEQIFSSIGGVQFKKDLSGEVFFACVKK